MAFVFKTKVGKGMLEVSGDNFKQVWEWASFAGDFPDKCSSCGSEDVGPMHKTPKGNEYFGFKCKACGAEQAFHQKKEGGFYVKWDDEFEKYQGSGGGQAEAVSKAFDDDIPDF